MPSLGNDLAGIRKEQGLSIEEIHKATKIPTHILTGIEDDSIFSDLNQNATYIRSYIRSFAKQLGINEERIIRALDQVEMGTYSGLLQKDYEGPLPKFQSRHKEKDEEIEEEESKDELTEDKPEEQPKQEEPQKKPEPEERPPKPAPPLPKPKEQPGPATPPAGTSEAPTVQSVDWVDMGKRFKPLKSRSRMWIGLAVLVLVVGTAGIIYYLNRAPDTATQEPSDNTPSTTEAVQPDSLQLNLSGPNDSDEAGQNVQTQAAESLSDTLSLAIYAAYEKLEPVRVYTDVMASLNPYWIELGEAVRFRFVNTIRIRGSYQRMELLLNGHLIENFSERFLNEESGLVEIDREVFEGDPKWLQPPPDSLGLSVPDPRVVRDQPMFN